MTRIASRQLHLFQQLHSGVNSELFLAQWSDGEGPVVVKRLRPNAGPHERRAFSNQVRVLSRRHGGVIPLLFADENARQPYYVLPYLSGTLTAYAGRLDGDRIRRVARRMALSLAGMHLWSDLHGDVKPSNVLVDAAGEIWLSDPLGNPATPFGWFAHNRGGTPGYWAPEVRIGASISSAADVYSFGATLWHLATGRVPREEMSVDEMIGAIDDALIRELIWSCCQPNPGMRPSMNDVLRLLNGESWSEVRKQRDVARTALLVASVITLFMVLSASHRRGSA